MDTESTSTVIFVEDLGTHLRRGMSNIERGHYAGGIRDLERALKIDPFCIDAYFWLGYAKHRTGDHAGAIEDLTAVIEAGHRPAEAHWRRGQAREASGDLTGAAEDYYVSLDLDPFNA